MMHIKSKSFHREVSLAIKSLGPDENQRAHFFKIKLGISGEINPLSGMIINLTDVDLILYDLCAENEGVRLEYFESTLEFPLLLKAFCQELLEQIQSKLPISNHVNSLVIEEIRGGDCLSWNPEQDWLLRSRHYLESTQNSGSVWELHLHWDLSEDVLIDFQREGLMMLKELLRRDWEPEALAELKGKISSKGGEINRVVLLNLADHSKLEF